MGNLSHSLSSNKAPVSSQKEHEDSKRHLVAHQNLMVRPCCWRLHTHWSQKMEKSSWYWPGNFLLAGYFHSTRRWYADCGTGWFISRLTQMWTTVMKIRHAHRCNNGTNVMAVTHHFLTGFKAHPQEKTHANYCKSAWKHTVGELIVPWGEPTAVVLLNGHSITAL